MKRLFTSLLTFAVAAVGWVTPAAAQDIADGDYYLYDATNKLFLSRGGAWGTEATADKYGVPFTWHSSTGIINFKDWSGVGLHIETNGTSVYTDNSSPTAFAFTATNGGYYLQNSDKTSYARYSIGDYGEYVNMTTDASSAVVWTLLTKAERDAIVEAYPTENKSAVATAAGITGDFDTTIADYVSETVKTIAPNDYTWSKVSRSDANSSTPREVYQGTGNFTTTVTGLSKGLYKISIQAFERDGWNGDCVTLNSNGYNVTTAYLLAGDQQVRIKGWAEDRGGDSNPNSVSDAKTLFDAGKYEVSVYAYVAEDNGSLALKVAVPSYKDGHWFIMGNTVVTYLKEGGKDDFDAALKAAQEALASSVYANVTGDEKTALSNAIETYKNTTSSYATATNALTTATTTFTSAKESYDSYVAEKAVAEALGVTVTTNPTTAAEAVSDDVMHTLNVAEYNAVNDNYTTAIDLGEWTTTGNVVDNKAQHWSGDATRTYKEQSGSDWSASSWSIGLSQEITLPAGSYAFKAAGRHSVDAVLSLTVTDADGNSLGSVSNFPSGDTGKGIDTNGAANFGDGTFANSNVGRAWQWRFVPFTLTEETKVTISVVSSAAVTHQWVSFCDYTVQAKPSVEASLAAYNQSLVNAEALLSNEDYNIVTGEERTNLSNAVSATVPTTVAGIDAAKENLDSLVATFTAAKTSYDAFVAAAKTADPNLEYASDAKHKAFTDAVAAATPASAADAVTKTAAITTALRAYYESNALAEGVEGAEQISISGDFSGKTVVDGKVGDWTYTQSGGSLQVLSGETWTNSDGSAGQSYFDYYNGSANNQHGYLDVDLEPGKYLVTVRARAQRGLYTYFKADDKTVDLQEIGNSGGVFNRGWNDASLVFTANGTTRLEWYSAAEGGNHAGWAGFGDVRLVKIADLEAATLDEAETAAPATSTDYQAVTLERTFAKGWNSIVLPFATTTDELGAAEALDYQGTKGDTIDFATATELKANTPYMVYYNAAKTDVTFAGKKIAPDEGITVTDAAGQYNFVGTYVALDATKSTIKSGDYIVNAGGIKKASGNNALKAFRAYFAAQTTTAKDLVFAVDGQVVTGIRAAELRKAVDDGVRYNMAGQRVGKTYKGIVISNGKKVLVK